MIILNIKAKLNREGERRDTLTCCSTYSLIEWLIDCCMYPVCESNLQP